MFTLYCWQLVQLSILLTRDKSFTLNSITIVAEMIVEGGKRLLGSAVAKIEYTDAAVKQCQDRAKTILSVENMAPCGMTCGFYFFT